MDTHIYFTHPNSNFFTFGIFSLGHGLDMALCLWMVAKIRHFSWRSLLFSQQKLAKKVLILSWSNFIDPCFFGGIGREGSVKDIICYKKRWGGGGNWSAVDVVPVRPNLPPLIHCSLILHTGENTGWFFLLVPPRKVLSMELVPPNREKLLSSPKMAKIPTKKVKVHVRVCQTFLL